MRPYIQGADDFQNHLFHDRAHTDEFRLAQELDEALYEKDIMLLRSQLKSTAKHTGRSFRSRRSNAIDACFGLSDEFSEPVSLQVDEEESEIGNSMQKLHLKNHNFASKEVVHDLYSELEEDIEIEDLLMSPQDELLFDELRDALTEKDIVDLRANMCAIAKSLANYAVSSEEIEDFVGGELDDELEKLIKEEAMINAALSSEITLRGEINSAVTEADIMKLRNSLQNISKERTSGSTKILSLASTKTRLLYWSAAASVIVLVAVSSLLQQRGISDQDLYASYFQPYNNIAGTSRSAVASTDLLNEAIREIDKGDYATALDILQVVSANKLDGFTASFYSGKAYQALGDYKNAINSYAKVVQQGDNLLVEQSKWFIGLCYLKINEREKAMSQFRSIVAGNGFYAQKSNDLLKQLR
jgi:tetratricopeptide (TPR) repeat protein